MEGAAPAGPAATPTFQNLPLCRSRAGSARVKFRAALVARRPGRAPDPGGVEDARVDNGLRPIARRATPRAGFTFAPPRGRFDPGIPGPIVQNPNCVPRAAEAPIHANR